MNIACIGVGNVGSAIAVRLVESGHTVVVAASHPDSDSVKSALSRNNALIARPVEDAVHDAESVFLATPFNAVENAVRSAGDLAGKVVVDCTNPIGAGMSHALDSRRGGGEVVQELTPNAHVVKAFSTYGYENFENPSYPGYGELRPAMLIAGNDTGAKKTVGQLCVDLGWEPVDTGDITMSLHLEHLALLWIKMARIQSRGPGFCWAMLKR